MRCLTLALMMLMMGATALADDSAGATTSTDMATSTDMQEMAKDITAQCLLNGHAKSQHLDQVRDGNYRTFLDVSSDHGVRQLQITPPEGEAAAGILIKWRSFPLSASIQVQRGEEWVEVAYCEPEFNAQYIPLPNLTETFRIIGRESENTKLQICELTVVTPGKLPEDFQVWQHPSAPVDLMLLSGHPDDEILWFGGLIPYYAGQELKQVVVVCATFNVYNRRLELLDCLWKCGVRVYPVFAGFEDKITQDVNAIYALWGRQRAFDTIAKLYRQYRPSVVVLQDEKGEYGHGVHRAFSLAGRSAVAIAADPEKLTDSGLEPYDVPKVYMHLWKENTITMDWHQPLSAFGGMTAQDVAREAFKCHVSQQGKRWQVEDGGIWDNSQFGLFHTTVGVDEKGGDMFEHID